MHYMFINKMCERAYLLLTSLRGTDTFSGETTLSKLFCLPSENWSTLEGKNFVPYEDIFPSEKRHLACKRVNRKLQKLSPLKKMADNLPSVSSPLDLIFNKSTTPTATTISYLILCLFVVIFCVSADLDFIAGHT